MYRLKLQNLSGLVGITLGLFLVLRGVAVADPGQTCIRTCEDREYFIKGSTGTCLHFLPRDCLLCSGADGACVPTLGYIDTDNCKRTSYQTLLTFFDSCDTPCNAVLVPGYTEALPPGGAGTLIGLQARYSCLAAPPPPGP